MAVRNLIPWNRFRTPAVRGESPNPLLAFYEEMNQLFDQFSRDFEGTGLALREGFGFPHVEESETDKEVKVQAELPGLSEKDIELQLNDGVLTIRGEKKSETEDKRRRMSEVFYGRFERDIPLPAEVLEDKVSASFKDGMLTVILPKSPQAVQSVKRIPIKGE
jgi:HSP20 family protein